MTTESLSVTIEGELLTVEIGTVAAPAGGGGASDHGALTGLADDDHTQYALADGSRGTFEASGAVSTHAGASDPHPGYLQNLAIHGTDAVIVVVGTNGEVLSRSSYTAATLIAAGAAAAPVQSVAGRTGAVVIAVGDVSGAEASANKAQANGYASLDSSGKVPQAQIPAIAITEYLGDVASQAAMLALSGQKGDWCTRSDTGAVWIISGTDPTLLGSWTAITYPASTVTSVAGRTGAVTLSAADITDSSNAGRAVLTAADAAAIRIAAGVVIGTDVQGFDAELAALAGLVSAADRLGYFTGSGTAALATFTAAARALLDDADAAAMLVTLGAQAALVSGTNIKTINSTSLLGSGDIAISGLTGFTAAESTSSPNATVPVASLTANNAATNVDAALVPKGTGAVIADVPDSTATGGNKRGSNAVDLQTSRTIATQVASATVSTLIGGQGNTASGIYSTALGGSSNVASGVGAIAGGFGNIASGAYSWALGGVNATTRGIQAAGVYGMARRAADGDRQTMVLPIACAARTDATATVMTSDAGAASATNQMVLPNNSSMFFEVDVVAHDSTLKSASWKVQGTIRRGANAAATAIVGTNVTTPFGSDLSGGSPGVTCTADTTNGALQVTFTGISATTIYPSGRIRTVIAA